VDSRQACFTVMFPRNRGLISVEEWFAKTSSSPRRVAVAKDPTNTFPQHANALRISLRQASAAGARPLSLVELTPEVIAPAAGRSTCRGERPVAVRAALTLLGGILQLSATRCRAVGPAQSVASALLTADRPIVGS
jgi:hypothetical protein